MVAERPRIAPLYIVSQRFAADGHHHDDQVRLKPDTTSGLINHIDRDLTVLASPACRDW